MSTRFGVPLLAVVITVCSANLASASYCGAANYNHCCSSAGVAASDAGDGSTTVMVTRKRVICVPEKYTAYRNCYETVYEDKTINCTSYVRENRVKQVNSLLTQIKNDEGAYPREMLLSQVTYLYNMINGADQLPGRDARERYRELVSEFESLRAEAERVIPNELNRTGS